APRWAPLLLALAAASLPVGAWFLSEVAAPSLLSRPQHRCPYCVLADAPESLVGIALFLLGVFATGWSCVLAWAGRHPETGDALGADVRRLLLVAPFGTLSAALFSACGLLASR